MSDTIRLPRLFVGSSVESLDVAYAVQENLEFDAETTVWSQASFQPSQSTLRDLIGTLDRFDFAAFVFASDDIVHIRGRAQPAVRDNVIFELGLFLGALGPNRCFIIMPRGAERPSLPTDLLGIDPLSYASWRSDQNLVGALGSACNKIRCVFRSAGAAPIQKRTPRPEFRLMSIHEYRATWNSPRLQVARDNLKEVVLDHSSDEFQSIKKDMRLVFSFLESLSAAVVDGDVSEVDARVTFKDVLIMFWPHAFTMLAPPNVADEYWEPPPRISELYKRWSTPSSC